MEQGENIEKKREDGISTIRVHNDTKNALTEMAKKNESYEQVIRKLIGGK